MSYLDINTGVVVADAEGSVRATFIKKTYLHLAGAIALFAIIETIFIKIGLGEYALKLLSLHGFAWIGVLLVYGFASHIMHKWALKSFTKEQQYLALLGAVVLEALIFLPMIMMALVFTASKSGAPNILLHAAVVTLSLVAGLTAIVFTTKKDFSFLAPALTIGGFVAFGLIIASIAFGFSLGLVFSGAMIIFAAGAILYETSRIMNHYHEDQYIGASLSLFASVGLLFWYVIQFMMSFTGSD